MMLVLYLATVPMWLIVGAVAFYDRRGMVAVGFILAGLNSIISAILKNGGTVAPWVENASAWASIAIVGIILGGYLGNRPSVRRSNWTT